MCDFLCGHWLSIHLLCTNSVRVYEIGIQYISLTVSFLRENVLLRDLKGWGTFLVNNKL